MTRFYLIVLCLGTLALITVEGQSSRLYKEKQKYRNDEKLLLNAAESKSVSLGCRKKTVGSAVLVGGARACQSTKPLKPSGILKMSKILCSTNGWGICSHEDRFVDQLSWKPDKMPAGCFAFRYGKKNKAAGYGKDCHANLYFHGILCCPQSDNPLTHRKNHFSKSNEYF